MFWERYFYKRWVLECKAEQLENLIRTDDEDDDFAWDSDDEDVIVNAEPISHATPKRMSHELEPDTKPEKLGAATTSVSDSVMNEEHLETHEVPTDISHDLKASINLDESNDATVEHEVTFLDTTTIKNEVSVELPASQNQLPDTLLSGEGPPSDNSHVLNSNIIPVPGPASSDGTDSVVIVKTPSNAEGWDEWE